MHLPSWSTAVISIISFTSGFFLVITYAGARETMISPVPEDRPQELRIVLERLPTPTVDPIPTAEKNSESLTNVVERELRDVDGNYAVVIHDLKNGEVYRSNEHAKFEPASLYKLWVMATVYKSLHEGTLKKEDVLTADVETLNTRFGISSESAELSDGVVTRSVEDAIEQMITVSHNYAAMLLSLKLRLSNVQSFLTELGFEESGGMGTAPYATAYDIARFLELLYDGKIVSKEASKEMIEVMSRQQLNGMIPKYLPKDVKVAHKTGEIDGFKHNAGIVYGKRPYIFVVMTETDDPNVAAERIAKLSKVVYEYFGN